MATKATTVRFFVSGSGFERGTERGVEIGSTRGQADALELAAQTGKDVVCLRLVNGPELRVSPEVARDILMSQAGATRSRDGAGDVLRVPQSLVWRAAQNDGTRRGARGTHPVGLAALSVLSGSAVTEATALALAEKLDAQVDEGLYTLAPDAPRSRRESGAATFTADTGKPLLVMLHGTFSSTAGSFGKLWTEQRGALAELFNYYGSDAVLAYDHHTLTASPLENAIGLYKALPANATVDLLTHSRGGLVGEVMARSSAADGVPFADEIIQGCPRTSSGKAMAAQMRDFNHLVATRKTRMRRLVRVACPAWGTLLAGKRLDVYLSVFKWLLSLAGLTPVAGLVEFLDAVARCRYDPEKLPGLAAMLREGPLVQVLNLDGKLLNSQLRVVAGDVQADSVGSWVKQLMADSFFLEDNDLVVQTSAMYGGARRSSPACFAIDQSGASNHFAYFRRSGTVAAIVSALTHDDDLPPGFRLVGPRSAAGADSSGTRGSGISNSGIRPLVIVLPGIMGSHLRRRPDGPRDWFDAARLFGALRRLSLPENNDAKIEANGSIGMYFDNFHQDLHRDHDVIDFSYDWRLGIELAAQRLGALIKSEIKRREGKNLPVSLVAHSMGGLVVRAVEFSDGAAWSKLLTQASKQWRILFLGTPHGGSYAPMQATTGDAGAFVNAAQSVGTWPWSSKSSRQISAEFVGLLQIQQDLLDPALKLNQEDSWKEYKKQAQQALSSLSPYHYGGSGSVDLDWGIPPQTVLDQAVRLRKKFEAQLQPGSALLKAPMCIVLGQADETPTRLEIDANGYGYQTTDRGDGRVSWEAGLLPGVPCWIVDVVHGSLANAKDCFKGYRDLLLQGSTTELEVFKGTHVKRHRRGTSRSIEGGTAEDGIRDPLALLNEAEGAPRRHEQGSATTVPALQINVACGDLRYVEGTLMVGHFDGSRLLGSEREIDQLFGGLLSRSLRAGLYPTAFGESEVFSQPETGRPGLNNALVVGLGLDGNTNARELRGSVMRGVLRYLRDVSSNPGLASTALTGEGVKLNTLCMGSGSGISVNGAVIAICNGVLDANAIARKELWPAVRQLAFVELFANRAREMLVALRESESVRNALVELVPPRLVEAKGGMARPTALRYRSADYDLVSITSIHVTKDGERSPELASLEFAMWSQRSRSELRGKAVQARLVQRLISSAEDGGADSNGDLGSTLFQLLVPLEMSEALSSSAQLVLDLDVTSAAIPWEALDDRVTRSRGVKPLAIRVPILRRLRTAEFRALPVDARLDDPALVIGEPKTSADYAPLEGAKAEAETVAGILGKEHLSLNESALPIIERLLSRRWRIVHVAGHGKLSDSAAETGVVLDGDCVLGPREIQSMAVVPELVFVNCCHLGKTTNESESQFNPTAILNRPLFAASVAEELIRMGVRCVVTAGWAVDDRAAVDFAHTFYQSLAAGECFREAVHDARKHTYEQHPGNNTWAAYQCYGDPYWRMTSHRSSQSANSTTADAGSDVCSAEDLIVALAALAAEANSKTGSAIETLRKRLEHFEYEFAHSDYSRRGDVAEAFAHAHQCLRQLDKAADWLHRAVLATDGRASMRANEQHYNTATRAAFEKVVHGEAAAAGVVEHIRKLAEQAQSFASMYATPERWRIAGASFKRLAVVQAMAGGAKAGATITMQLDAMTNCYQAGIANESSDFYPLMQLAAVKLVQPRGANPKARALWTTGVNDLLDRAEALLHEVGLPSDFWSRVARVELKLLRKLSAGKVSAASMTELSKDFENVHHTHRNPHEWNSVADNVRFLVKVGTLQRASAVNLQTSLQERLLTQVDGFSNSKN